MKDNIVKARIELGLLFLLLAIIVPRVYMVFDFEYWTDWALYIHRHGLTQIYHDPIADYHPLYYYFLYLYGLINGSEFFIVENINFVKLLPLVFDFLPIVVFCCFKQQIFKGQIPYMYLLLNIAYLFNTLVWGQLDSIHTALCFFALVAGFSRPVFSAFIFAVALALKPQPIIYLPVLGIVWLYSVRNVKTALLMLLAIGGTLLTVAMPFILAGEFDGLWHIVTTAVGRYPRVSVGAFNLWYLITPGNPYFITDTSTYFILSYKHIGLLLFFASSGLVLLPLLLRILRNRRENLAAIGDDTMQMLLLAAGLIALYFFYFNTQMHERYAHPIILFFFFYAMLSKNYKLYILASIPYFLSLDKLFPDFLPVVHYKIIWASKVIAIWYTLTVAYGSWLYFKAYRIKREYRALMG